MKKYWLLFFLSPLVISCSYGPNVSKEEAKTCVENLHEFYNDLNNVPDDFTYTCRIKINNIETGLFQYGCDEENMTFYEYSKTKDVVNKEYYVFKKEDNKLNLYYLRDSDNNKTKELLETEPDVTPRKKFKELFKEKLLYEVDNIYNFILKSNESKALYQSKKESDLYFKNNDENDLFESYFYKNKIKYVNIKNITDTGINEQFNEYNYEPFYVSVNIDDFKLVTEGK